MRKHIFTAGPAVLPEEVLQTASQAILEFNGSGQSILEVSHRGKEFDPVIKEAQALTLELLGLGDDYTVLFLQGGASTQFLMVPYNMLSQGQKAAYLDTGTWANKAIKEAKRFGEVAVMASSKDANYNYIPKDYTVPTDAEYVHITSNNTIFGTQLHAYPKTDRTLVIDMSSDIFCRPVNMSQFDLIYAGAQKNLGPAGTTLVILKKELLDRMKADIPAMMSYRVHVDAESLYNTPAVYAIYICNLTLKWLKAQGGVDAMGAINQRKAAKVYDAIDAAEVFKGAAATEDRSLMNITFTLKDSALDDTFMGMAKEAGIVGLKGHRSVGGFRASVYNALPEASVDVLVDVMKTFAQKHG